MAVTQTKRERTPRGQGKLLRQRLIDAAWEILDEGNDASEISIRGVTRRAGVSPTAFYLHFADREELMRVLFENGFTDFRGWIREGAERGTNPQQRLMSACAAYIAFSRERPGRYRLIFAADLDAEGILGEAGEKPAAADAAFHDLVELITTYIGGDGPPDDVETLAVGFWSGLHGYATLCQTQPKMADLTDEQYTALLANAWLGPSSGR